jgi:predicted nucleotidyltransferase
VQLKTAAFSVGPRPYLIPCGTRERVTNVDRAVYHAKVLRVGPSFPDEWRRAIRQWAAHTSLVTAVYLVGSRAKGCARSDSDIDLAFLTRPDGTETAYTVAFFNKERWAQELQALLPKPVDLQHADPGEDEIVWPAVQEHGVRIV